MTKANLPNSKWFCIYDTDKSNCQVFTQSHILLDFNTIFNFFYHSQIKFSLYCQMERGHQLILKQRFVLNFHIRFLCSHSIYQRKIGWTIVSCDRTVSFIGAGNQTTKKCTVRKSTSTTFVIV